MESLHKEDYAFQCSLCQYKSSTGKEFQNHVMKYHVNPPKSTTYLCDVVQCPLCQHKCATGKEFQDHVMKYHVNPPKEARKPQKNSIKQHARIVNETLTADGKGELKNVMLIGRQCVKSHNATLLLSKEPECDIELSANNLDREDIQFGSNVLKDSGCSGIIPSGDSTSQSECIDIKTEPNCEESNLLCNTDSSADAVVPMNLQRFDNKAAPSCTVKGEFISDCELVSEIKIEENEDFKGWHF